MARGDSLDNIMTKAEALEDKSVIFHKRAKKLKCAMLQENIKMCVLLTAIIIVRTIQYRARKAEYLRFSVYSRCFSRWIEWFNLLVSGKLD